jgi:hypothetical protein
VDALYSAHAAFSLFRCAGKKLKIDSSGITKDDNKNVAEIHNQALMMLGHVIFDPETNRNVLVDHAFIVSGGVITKQARNWLGGNWMQQNAVKSCLWTARIS